MRRISTLTALACLAASLASAAPSTQRYSDMRWRNIGPFRAGWSTCVAGVPGKPDTFYFGAAVGGVWKSDDAGRTWQPLFQHEGAASIGALAIAPSNPDILYAGTGQVATRYDIASGDGVYRSDDGGKTWRHVGLTDTRAIGRIVVDPKNPDVVLAAALGHIFGPNDARGVFRSEDGGRTWTRTLFVNADTGAVDLAADPDNPAIVYAAAWQVRNFPWLSYFRPNQGPGSGVYKSTDEGRTWTRLSGGGWPSGTLGRIGLAAAPGGRLYAMVDARSFAGNVPHAPTEPAKGGIYRTDDGGRTWLHVNSGSELQSDYFGRITADPRDRDTLYATGRSVERSTDGGKTFHIIKGAPGGDDYHFVWVNPEHPGHLAVASDQGTVVSVNGGRTWSSWYNQPTGQFYHLAADDRFPYWIYSGQQDSGTVGIASRSDYGALSYREWHPVGGDERDYDVPDPGDPNTVYASGLGGNLSRFDARTGQVAAINPHVESTYARRANDVKYRYTWFTPIAVSPRPPYAVYQGSQYLFRSTDRGQSWTIISPDLSGAVSGTKGCGGDITLANAQPCGFGVIYSIALGATDREIWIGTDDGRIRVTHDGGKHWGDVTPKGLSPWSKIAALDISALDPGTVYAAVDRHRLDDFTPHILRTHDGGKSWTEITAGIPSDSFVDVVRADPETRGLLYAGTDRGVFVSFDDGDRWEALQLNLPTVWVRDLLVHGDDLVAATEGRAIWILDDVTPLRQMGPEVGASPAVLFRPEVAYRLRRDENRDTPLPPETPLGQNPPTGAILDYVLGKDARGPVTIEILDAHANLVRRYASDEPPAPANAERYFQAAWLKPEPLPATSAGHHRFLWDLRYPAPRALGYEYSIAAVWGENTPAEPQGALALPGSYTVRLTADGVTRTQPLTLKEDPRVSVSSEALSRQLAAAQEAAGLMERSASSLAEVRAYLRAHPSGRTAAEAAPLASGPGSFARVNGTLSAIFSAVESADESPTAQALTELQEASDRLDALERKWEKIRGAK